MVVLYAQDIKGTIQLNLVKTISLNASEYVRSLMKFSKVNITIKMNITIYKCIYISYIYENKLFFNF